MKLVKVLLGAALCAATFTCICIALLALELKKTAASVGSLANDVNAKVSASPNPVQSLDSVIKDAGKIVTKLSKDEEVAAWKINGDGGSPANPHRGPYDGILTKVYKDLQAAHTIEFNINKEQLQLYQQLNRDSPELFTSLKTSTGKLPELLQQATDLLSGGKDAINKLALKMDDPVLMDLLKNVDLTSGHIEKTTASFQQLMEYVTEKITNPKTPSKKKQAWKVLLLTLELLAKFG